MIVVIGAGPGGSSAAIGAALVSGIFYAFSTFVMRALGRLTPRDRASSRSARWAERLAEVEPFKTAIILKFIRDWPFVLFAFGVLAAGWLTRYIPQQHLFIAAGLLGAPGPEEADPSRIVALMVPLLA